jgi:hypothetical protein
LNIRSDSHKYQVFWIGWGTSGQAKVVMGRA